MRRLAPSVLSLLIIAAGCSARTGFYVTDGGTEGGSTSLTPDAGKTDSGKKKDGAVEEEEEDLDASTTPDAKKDTSTPPVDVCEPGSISGFTPTWKVPAPFHASSCTTTQVDTLMCLFDSAADPTACDTAVKAAANQTCFNCIFTQSTATAPGPVIITGSLGSINLAGCIARASGNVTSTGCGAKVQAADQCGDAACEANCPIDDTDNGESLDARNQCTTDAASTVCATYDADSLCAEDLLLPDGGAAACAQGTDFLSRATAIAKLFCVP